MYSKAHGAISLALGIALVAAGVTVVHPAFVVGYATAIGVLVDLDHFLWARYNTGDWRALRYVLTNPVAALADQQSIFREHDLERLERLLSHVVIVGIAVPLTWWVEPDLGLVTGVTLYAHVLADLIEDVRETRVVR
ncbi:hypothetical protein [Halapricum hydrolyticum]|uniref:Uncharacterized protein n=1 Tax=Halapricum hydrolyticum TaxID=2979991 RepID=A0AAE3LF53_9EURY|nr:hypothetical protein [Halapricum hydrolyticum]MCU4718336.1 hypothetical protein [Halapricum hydrolyticum]MCU4727216.1 hypothetical protein [Halapricum hydrolyticum]